jgi:NifU-like protein
MRLLESDHFFHPRNVGEASEPSFVGRAASLKCGATLRVSIQIDESHRISEAKFKAAGCTTLVSFLSMLTEQVRGLAPVEAAVIGQQPAKISGGDIENSECAKLACQALLTAIGHYSDAAREEWIGDEALICTCFCVSETTIEREIKTKGLTTVSEVTRACYAGGGCGSCHQLIEEMLDSVERV